MVKYVEITFFLLVLAFGTGCAKGREGGADASKPNIVLIMTDDQGYGDLGFTGNPFIHTPNIDQFAAKSTHFSNFYVDPVLYRNEVAVSKTGYCTDVFTEGALEFISDSRDKPFFLYLAYNAPHGPLQVPEQYLERYQGKSFGLDTHEAESARRVYAMVENVDENVGRILHQLENYNLMDNTVVIFMSDNGPIPSRYNSGLRAGKGCCFFLLDVEFLNAGYYHITFKFQHPPETAGRVHIKMAPLERS